MLYYDNFDTLIIDFEKTVYSENFFSDFYVIQKLIEENPYSFITVNMNDVIYFDTMSLCTFLLSINRAVDTYNPQVEFAFHSDVSGEEHIRFYYFLYTNGFLSSIEKLVSDESKEKYEIQIALMNEQLLGSKVYLDRTQLGLHSCIIPFEIVENRDYISDHMEEIRKKTELVIGKELSRYDFDLLFNKMSLFLQETVENVFEHAYANNEEKKYCAIIAKKAKSNYVDEKKKYRNYGSTDNCLSGKVSNNEYLNIIRKKTPYANKSLIEKSAFIEIFVIDIGRGIIASFDETDHRKDRNILDRIFTHGARSNKAGKTSKAGGLYMLNNLLAKDNDDLAIKSDYNWFCFKCSLANVSAPPTYICLDE